MVTQDILTHLDIIKESIAWAEKYGKESFPQNELAQMRRRLKTIHNALDRNCSAAAYGESQVGKSYLMSALLSSNDSPFTISDGEREYNFIDELNPSGGNNSKKEATGVITRFTLQSNLAAPVGYVRLELLSVTDVVMMLVDAYYNDIKTDADTALSNDDINNHINAVSISPNRQNYICSDDIADIVDYIKENVGVKANAVVNSKWGEVAAYKIEMVEPQNWNDLFSILWNNNEYFSRLFKTIVSYYCQIKFTERILVPFDALKRKHGTLLDIQWLDAIMNNDCKRVFSEEESNFKQTTQIKDLKGNVLCNDFLKSILSALIREVVFTLPQGVSSERPFLNDIDLLDFPGARSRLQIRENEAGENLSQIFRRGKVAYLLNKYSRELRITSFLFCHHNDQREVTSLSESIRKWIENNIGKNVQERRTMLLNTQNISPLFFVATKFNKDLAFVKTDSPDDKEGLSSHWIRFNKVIPELIPESWFNEWDGGPFRDIYPLRDFYWSSQDRLFEGYSDKVGNKKPELKRLECDGYAQYWDDLEESFVRNPFVTKHFNNPKEAWKNVATVGQDGSKPIIDNLNKIAQYLNSARLQKLLAELIAMRADLQEHLNVYYVSDADEQRNAKLSKVVGDIRMKLDSVVGRDPYRFGRILDSFMLSSDNVRRIAYDIIVLKTEVPKDFSQANFIRTKVGISADVSRENSIRKLCDYYIAKDETELAERLLANGTSLEEVLGANDEEVPTNVSSLVVKNIIAQWSNHINHIASDLSNEIPHIDEIANMMLQLVKMLGVKKLMVEQVQRYLNIYDGESVCNAIADYATLTLNNFVSTVGSTYLKTEDVSSALRKAQLCNIKIESGIVKDSETESDAQRKDMKATIVEAFDVMKRSENIAEKPIDMTALKKLPLWNNFSQWEDRLTVGLIISSEIADVDPVANKSIGDLIEKCNGLYVA